jgi:hypothetical protein
MLAEQNTRISQMVDRGGRSGPLRQARGGRRWILAASALAVALALAAPVAASAAPAGSSSTSWKTHVFSVSYDGSGSFNYTAQGANGDAGCFMRAGNNASYGFDQLWTIKVAFKSAGNGNWDTKIVSIHHTDGPQLADNGASHLKGQQSNLGEENCSQLNIVHDTGKYDCTSTKLTLTAFPNPQLAVTRESGDLVFIAKAFLGGHWDYTGSDTIPSDKNGCHFYDDDMTYGSDLAPGLFAAAKVSIAVSRLAGLKAGKASTEASVGLNKNTEFPPQSECASVFGDPHKLCVLHSHKFSGTFRVHKVH